MQSARLPLSNQKKGSPPGSQFDAFRFPAECINTSRHVSEPVPHSIKSFSQHTKERTSALAEQCVIAVAWRDDPPQSLHTLCPNSTSKHEIHNIVEAENYENGRFAYLPFIEAASTRPISCLRQDTVISNLSSSSEDGNSYDESYWRVINREVEFDNCDPWTGVWLLIVGVVVVVGGTGMWV